jgi:nucleoid DNA-binding protein
VTKADFVKVLKEKAGIETTAKAEAAYEALFGVIADSLKEGEPVTIIGFGTFKVSVRSARKGRNPQTGKPMDIPASKTVKFTVSKALKESL